MSSDKMGGAPSVAAWPPSMAIKSTPNSIKWSISSSIFPPVPIFTPMGTPPVIFEVPQQVL